jgi:hypothetical protein
MPLTEPEVSPGQGNVSYDDMLNRAADDRGGNTEDRGLSR